MVPSDRVTPSRTRACDLPWKNFRIDTTTEPPPAAPCRNYPFDWNARDLTGIGAELQRLRDQLRTGLLAGPCRTCQDKELVPLPVLQDLLDREDLAGFDGNQLLDAVHDVIASAPVAPPPDLTYRVAHTRDAGDFLLSGLITLFDFLPFVLRYDSSDQRRLLDWGCGSGRLAIHLATRHPEIQLSGCDIDAEAVQWCRDNLSSGDFHVINPLPPAQFPRGRFTTITGYSIVTHLSRDHQVAWIDELHQLLADEGIVILTTMGETAARVHGLSDRLEAEGILDDRLDTTLDSVMPEGYYRSTFQTRSWTEQAWGRHFELLEYVEAGAFNFQDIVVLRKKRVHTLTCGEWTSVESLRTPAHT